MFLAEILHESHNKHESQFTENDPVGVKSSYNKRLHDKPQPCRGWISKKQQQTDYKTYPSIAKSQQQPISTLLISTFIWLLLE
jgi:hypothetical protein